MSKTIKQIADELGVSKQAVRDKIAKLGLHGTLQKIGNQLCVSKTQEILIKSAFLENQLQTNNAIQLCENNSQSQSTLQLISMLERELDIKNKHIEEFNLRLAEAHKMAQQAQQLHGADKALELKEAQEPKLIDNKKKKWNPVWKK